MQLYLIPEKQKNRQFVHNLVLKEKNIGGITKDSDLEKGKVDQEMSLVELEICCT